MAETGSLRSALLRVVRGVLLLVGVAVFTLGILAVAFPGVAGALPVDAMVAALGSDYVVVAAVGMLAVAFAVLVLLVVAVSGVDEADLPVVESVESAPHPGQAVDRTVDGGAGGSVPHARIERLTRAAVETLMRVEHVSRSEAERRVAEGTWTDDEVAADFLAAGDDGLLRTAVADEDRVRRTAEEIEALANATSPGADATTPDDRVGSGQSDEAAEPDRHETVTDRTVRARKRGATVARDGGTETGGR